MSWAVVEGLNGQETILGELLCGESVADRSVGTRAAAPTVPAVDEDGVGSPCSSIEIFVLLQRGYWASF